MRCCTRIAAMGRYGYPRELRLLKKRDFDRLFAAGRRVSRGPLRLVYLRRGVTGLRCGTVTGRRVGGAVERNRLRRRLRELYRLHRHHLVRPLHFAILGQQGAGRLGWDELRELVLGLWREAGLLEETERTETGGAQAPDETDQP